MALAFAPWTESENIQLLLLCKRLYKRTSRRFCWTEAGAETVGIIHSLASTCRLLGINPYTDLVAVLQRSRYIQTVRSKTSRRGAGRPCLLITRCAQIARSLPELRHPK